MINIANTVFITDQLEDSNDSNPHNVANQRAPNELGKELLKAASEGNIHDTHRLLHEGAPFTADWLGTSPLHLAAQGNHVEICDILLNAGISANAKTKVDRTPLHLAAYEGHVNIVQLLLKEEADPNEVDLLGMTPLHWSVQNGHLDVTRVLLNGGAQKYTENKFGLKPLDIAHQIERYDIIQILEEEQIIDTAVATKSLATDDAKIDQSALHTGNIITMEDTDDCSNIEDEIPHIKFEMDNSLSDSMKILQEHGITLLPTDDDNNILSTVMESGHSVVLTEVGKQILDAVKAQEESVQNITRNLAYLERERCMTVNPDDLFADSPQLTPEKQKKHKEVKRRVVMKRSKVQPVLAPNILKQTIHNVNPVRLSPKEIEIRRLLKELKNAEKTVEEYKEKLEQKEIEVDDYKMKLKLLGYS